MFVTIRPLRRISIRCPLTYHQEILKASGLPGTFPSNPLQRSCDILERLDAKLFPN